MPQFWPDDWSPDGISGWVSEFDEYRTVRAAQSGLGLISEVGLATIVGWKMHGEFDVLALHSSECEAHLSSCNIPPGVYTQDQIDEINGSATSPGDVYYYYEAHHPDFWNLLGTASAELNRVIREVAIEMGEKESDIRDRMANELSMSESRLKEPGRKLYWNFGEGSTGGGSGGTQPPPPFLAGGPWAATQFQGKSFRLEPVLEAGFLPARRPGVGGAIIEHPHRYATLHVIDIDGKVKFSTTDFSMTAVKKQVGEKFQLISTFDGEHLLFQCDKGKIYQFNFKMLDSQSYDWLRAFELNWNRLFRGTQLAKQQSRLYIMYGGTLIGGYPLAMSVSQTAEQEPISGMAISMYVTDDVPLPNMKVIDRRNGVYQWKGEAFRVGSGVSGRLAIDTELPVGSKGGAEVGGGSKDALDAGFADDTLGTYDDSLSAPGPLGPGF